MTDILRFEYINSLGPLTASIVGSQGIYYDVDTLCVQTGCMKVSVCGKAQLSHIGEVHTFKDWDGNEYDPDDFYIEEKENDL